MNYWFGILNKKFYNEKFQFWYYIDHNLVKILTLKGKDWIN